MSSDEKLSPRSQRAPRSKKTDPVTPDGSESDSDDVEESKKGSELQLRASQNYVGEEAYYQQRRDG